MQESEKSKWGRSVVSNSLWPHGLQPTRLLHPWDFPGKSTGVGCHCQDSVYWTPTSVFLVGRLLDNWCQGYHLEISLINISLINNDAEHFSSVFFFLRTRGEFRPWNWLLENQPYFKFLFSYLSQGIRERTGHLQPQRPREWILSAQMSPC